MADDARVVENDSIIAVCLRGDVDALRELLNTGTSPDTCTPQGVSALLVAVQQGREPCVKVLLDAGADPEFAGFLIGGSVLDAVVNDEWAQHILPAIRLLAKRSQQATIDAALNSASLFAPIEVVECLLECGANPNADTHGKYTPLMNAADRSSLRTLSLLLEYGADPTARTLNGDSAIDIAVHAEAPDCLRMLREWSIKRKIP